MDSVTKTFLTTVVGLAWQRGLIRDVNDYARDYIDWDNDVAVFRSIRGGQALNNVIGKLIASTQTTSTQQ